MIHFNFFNEVVKNLYLIVTAALSTSVKPFNKFHSFKTRIKGLITKFQIELHGVSFV